MQINDFRAVVSTFADPGTEILFDRSQVLISVNGDIIEAKIASRGGDIFVDEGAGQQPATQWIAYRLAKLHLLAARLLTNVLETDFFVSPGGVLLPTLERGPAGQQTPTSDALQTARTSLEERSPLETTVMYVTSDAGEGKTSLINEIARLQAKRYTDNQSDWLLVPITLGGRHFLRFDDITIGTLQNKYRFPFLYYTSFLALVRMGIIVPAFDGFEEMFVESSSGEALSAMGILVSSLDSQGAMIVAARKAYFEFENLRTQERLFDTIRRYSVGFSKLELSRWSKQQFLDYARKRGIANAEELYRRVAERLTPSHALLTRAVLVRNLLDVASASASLDDLLEQLQKSGPDFFSVFVRSLVEREANLKWIDRSGEMDVGSPLLTVEEHCELLSLIALSMWESRVDYIKRDNLEFVADYFAESERKNSFQSQQIRERIRGHAMLIPSANADGAVEFDHDEFRFYFLGEGVARQLQRGAHAKAEALGTFRRGALPQQSLEAAVRSIVREPSVNRIDIVKTILDIAKMDGQASYTQENCSDIAMRLLSGIDGKGLVMTSLAFSANSLRDRKLRGIRFEDCYFSPTSIELTEIEECDFVACNFSQLRVFNTTKLTNVSFERTTVDAFEHGDTERASWEPSEVRRQLAALGVRFHDEEENQTTLPLEREMDQELRDLTKIVRYFMRSTHISEGVVLMKLGPTGQSFLDGAMPQLLKHRVLTEIENRGGGDQLRFRLGTSLQAINAAIATAKGSFGGFLMQFPV